MDGGKVLSRRNSSVEYRPTNRRFGWELDRIKSIDFMGQMSWVNASFRNVADFLLLAERVGFEPTVGKNPTHALQACLIDHSSTSPRRGWDSNPRSDIIGDRFSRAAP